MAGLPTPNPRDNSSKTSCTDLGCTQLITTDAISVYVFDDETAARRRAEALGPEGGHRAGTVVLNYAAARTPPADQPRYERVLATAIGGWPRRCGTPDLDVLDALAVAASRSAVLATTSPAQSERGGSAAAPAEVEGLPGGRWR